MKQLLVIFVCLGIAACGDLPPRQCPAGWATDLVTAMGQPWQCGNPSLGAFTLDLAVDGTGTSDLLGALTWAEAGCDIALMDGGNQVWVLADLVIREVIRYRGPQVMMWNLASPQGDVEAITCREL